MSNRWTRLVMTIIYASMLQICLYPARSNKGSVFQARLVLVRYMASLIPISLRAATLVTMFVVLAVRSLARKARLSANPHAHRSRQIQGTAALAAMLVLSIKFARGAPVLWLARPASRFVLVSVRIFNMMRRIAGLAGRCVLQVSLVCLVRVRRSVRPVSRFVLVSVRLFRQTRRIVVHAVRSVLQVSLVNRGNARSPVRQEIIFAAPNARV